MNERIKDFIKQLDLRDNDIDLERFAELVRQDERKACAEIAKFATMHCIADAIMRRGDNK